MKKDLKKKTRKEKKRVKLGKIKVISVPIDDQNDSRYKVHACTFTTTSGTIYC